MTRLLNPIALLAILPAALLLAAAPPDNQAGQEGRVTTTDRVDFAPSGTIRITGAHGDLNIQAWDRPQIEVTLTKYTRGPDRITVTLERKSPSEVTIATRFPPRSLTRPFHGKSNVILEYQIHVPKNSNLLVHDDLGTVSVNGVAGDIEAHVGMGDITLVLPASEGYAIDARTTIGTVESDLGGAAPRSGLFGRKLSFAPATPNHRLHLRVKTGGITIKSLPNH